MPTYYTGKGDDGTTGLLGKGRVPKYHPRPDAYGQLDEASASLAFARSKSSPRNAELLKAAQRDLYVIMTEVASTQGEFTRLDHERVDWIEREIERVGDEVELPKVFVMFGETEADAALDLARTCVRRAERALAQLFHEGTLENASALAYVNRLSSLCYLLALWENKHAGASLSKTK